MSKKNRKHKKEGVTKGLDYMIRCPICKGMSYPLNYIDPKNEVEENAVLCGSCKQDLYPFMKAMEEFQKQQEEKNKLEEKANVEMS
jgi:uncharacterized protein YbaR (Trm112 family)